MTVYYVAAAGSGGNSGLVGFPKQTFAQAAALATTSDRILLNRGDTFRETAVLPANGASGAPFTVGNYGSGALPVVSAADLFASWTSAAVTTGENFTDVTGTQALAWWMLEEASSPAQDGGAGNNDLTWVGSPVRTSSHVQGSFALSTPTTSDLARCLFAAQGATLPMKAATTEFTVGGWIYLKGNIPVNREIAWHGDESTMGWYLHATSTIGKLVVQVFSAGGVANVPSDAAYTTDGWHHVLARWNGNNTAGAGANDEISLWVDGVKQSTTVIRTSVTVTTAGSLQLKGAADGVIAYDEWAYFDKALLDTEIADLYSYRLDGSAGTSVTTYYATCTTEPKVVYDNDTRLPPAASVAAMTPGSSFWDSGTSRLYVRLAADANPSGHTIQAAQRAHAIEIGAHDWVTLDGVQAEFGNSPINGTIHAELGSATTRVGLVTQNCTVRRGAGDGVLYINWPAVGTLTDAWMTGNTIVGCGRAGLHIEDANATSGHENLITWNDVSGCAWGPGEAAGIDGQGSFITMEYNTIHDNGIEAVADGGMHLNGKPTNTVTNGIIRYNRIYNQAGHAGGPDGYGISLDFYTSGCVAHHNLVYNIGGPGIYLFDAVSGSIINNTVYNACSLATGTLRGGIRLTSASTGTASFTDLATVKDNICVMLAAGAYPIYVDANTSANTLDITANDWWHTTGGANWYFWNVTGGNNLATWNGINAGVGTDRNDDPLLADAAGGDFTLQGTSPARDSGVLVVGVNDDFWGAAPDMGAEELGPLLRWRRLLQAVNRAGNY